MGLLGIFAHGITADLGNGEGADRLGGVREGAPHRRQHHPKWTDEALKAIGLTAEGLMEPNTQ